MTVTGRNFINVTTPDVIDAEYVLCNFSQLSPSTRLFPGDDTPRTFRDCNLMNCLLPPGSASPGSPPTARIRDPANDETVTIMGEAVVIEAFTVVRT